MLDILQAIGQLLLYDLGFVAVLLVALVPLALWRPAAFAVLKRNLVSYFSNPTGYVFLCVFVALASFALFWTEKFFVNNLATLDQLNFWIPFVMLIFIPSITMSIWADERRQGTDELILTLPAGDFDIVFGKYIAAASTFTVSLIYSQICTFAFVSLLADGDIDTGLFFTSFLGYWLMGLAMVALGMVASFLTTNLTVAFILGALFNSVPVFLVYASLILPAGWQPHLFSRWSFHERFDDMGRGVASLSTLSYFALIIVLGIYLSIILIGRRHWLGGRDGHSMLGHYFVRALSLVLILIGANVLFSNHDLVRQDFTSGQVSSLSADTKKILQNLENKHPVRIDAYISARVPDEFVKTKYNLVSMLKELQRYAGTKVVVNLHDNLEEFSPEATLAEDRFGIRRMSVPTRVRGETRQQEFIMGAALTCGVEKVVVPFFSNGMPVEYELVRAIATAAQPKRKKLGIVTTEANLRGGFTFAGGQPQQLPKQAFLEDVERQYTVEDVDTNVSLEVYDADGALKYDALLVVQPSTLTPPQLNNLIEAIKQGQPAVIFEDPVPYIFGSVVGTNEDKPGPGGFMGMGAPPQPKGEEFEKLWKALGIEPLAEFDAPGPMPAKVVCQPFMPYKKFGDIPGFGPFVFVRTEESGTFNPEEASVKNFEELFLPMPGGIREAADIKDLKLTFTKLIETSDVGTSLIDASAMKEFLGARDEFERSRLLSEKLETTGRAYTLAAWIRGEAKADEKTDSKEASKDKSDKKVEKKEEAKGDQKSKQRPLSVIYVADIDVLHNQLFNLRNFPDEDFRWDNIPFVLNLIDSVCGEDRYLAIRQRKLRYSTLRRIERETQKAHEVAEKEVKDYQTKNKDEVKKQDEAVEKLQKEADDYQAQFRKKQQTGESVDFNEFDATMKSLSLRLATALSSSEKNKAELRVKLQKEMEKIRRESLQKVTNVQNIYKLFTLFIPPIPPMLVGFVVWLRRYLREREGISKTRMKY